MKPNPLNPGQFQATLDQAKYQASVLRDAAIGDFWRGADAVLTKAHTDVSRSAERLRHALTRHWAGRTTASTRLEG